MRRGRTRPAPRGRGRKMARGGSCGGTGQMPCGGAMRRGGRPAQRGRGRQMASGGRGRRFQAGGHSHDAGHIHPQQYHGSFTSHGDTHYPGLGTDLGNTGHPQVSGSWGVMGGAHPHGPGESVLSTGPHGVQTSRGPVRRKGGRPAPRGRGRQMTRGGRARPAPRRGGGRQMTRGGRAPARKFQGGGSGGVECPAGSFKTADGRCTQMGS